MARRDGAKKPAECNIPVTKPRLPQTRRDSQLPTEAEQKRDYPC